MHAARPTTASARPRLVTRYQPDCAQPHRLAPVRTRPIGRIFASPIVRCMHEGRRDVARNGEPP